MTHRSILVLILLPLTLLSSANAAFAEEITVIVEGNGGGSSQEVHIESTSTTTVEQNNETNIENHVDANANTGNNEASHNSGDTYIQTGDAQVDTQVHNTNINHNSASTPPCNCNDGGVIHVNGNASGSHNTVHTSVGGTHVTHQNNTANITNDVVTHANTGRNKARANGGDVTIKTGSIDAKTNIVNEDVNISTAEDTSPGEDSVAIHVGGNGAGSVNTVAYKNLKNTVYAAKNVANIYNSDIKNLNTGGNTADFNLGDVWIGTGDIVAVTEIINKGINVNDYTKTCDCEKPGEETPPTVTPPTKPPHHNGESRDNGNGGVGGNGDVMGAANGDILPVTGQLTYLFLTLSAIILFLAGWYLRFRSGVAPGAEIVA